MPNIEEDNADLKKAVAAAKCGDFGEDFWSIMKKKKPYLINCIPEDRSWGVLHQAVYWKNLVVVNRLLAIPSCDALIRTRRCRLNDARPSSTPQEVAKQLGGRENIADILATHEKVKRAKRFSGSLTYKVTRKDGRKIVDQLPVLMKAVVMYKDTLLETTTSIPDSLQKHLFNLMKEIFNERHDNWEAIGKKLHEAMYGIDANAAAKLKVSSEKSSSDLFKDIITFYTGNTYYETINDAIHRDFSETKPTAEDMAIALYDLLLDVIIMFWNSENKFKKISETTYRGYDQRDHYDKDSVIMFTEFISSSLDDKVAERWAKPNGTLLFIDNSLKSMFQPRLIEEWSEYKHERECLYGIGAEFKVQKVDNSGPFQKVYLKLVNGLNQ